MLILWVLYDRFMTKSVKQVLRLLKNEMPEMWYRMNPKNKDSFNVSSEDEYALVEGIPAFSYYGEVDCLAHDCVEEFGDDLTKEEKAIQHKEIERHPTYVSGIHRKIHDILEKSGWIAEWENSGVCTLSKF